MYIATFNKIIILKSFEYTLLSDFQKFCHYKYIKTNLIFHYKKNYIEKSEAIAKTNRCTVCSNEIVLIYLSVKFKEHIFSAKALKVEII